ncbi:hypothetical protein MTO96_031625 [Rhipicephalus appendiculatus]
MHSNGCPLHEFSQRMAYILALKVLPSWHAMYDSCASNLRIKRPLRPGWIVPQQSSNACCQRQGCALCRLLLLRCERNQPVTLRIKATVFSDHLSASTVTRNSPNSAVPVPAGASTEKPPPTTDTATCVSGPSESSSVRPSNLGRSCQRRKGRSTATSAPPATVDTATSLRGPTTKVAGPTAHPRYPLRQKYSDAVKGHSDN